MITHRDLAVTALVAGATIAAMTFADSTGKRIMESSAFQWNALKAEPKPHGARREVFDARVATLDRLECHVTTLNPGQVPHPAHQHPEEELIIIKEGTIEAVQNGVTNRVEAGGILFEASNQMHGLRNVGTTTATYYVVKWFSPGTLKSKPD